MSPLAKTPTHILPDAEGGAIWGQTTTIGATGTGEMIDAAPKTMPSTGLFDALRRNHHDTARHITGVPPVSGSPADPYRAEPAQPPTAGEQFREHKHALLWNLEMAYILPAELCRDWGDRIEPLDIEEPEWGLKVIGPIREEFDRMADRLRPSPTEVSRRMEWERLVPRIRHEIDWVEGLFRHVLQFD